MNRKHAILLIVPFLCIIFGLGIASIITPDEAVSFYESRDLAPAPKFSDFIDGTFPLEFENYWVDHFFIRDEFLKMYTYEQIYTMKSRVRNIYISGDGFMIENTSSISDKEIASYAKEINSLSRIIKENGKLIYYVPVGYASSQLAYKVPGFLKDDQGSSNRNRLTAMLSDDIKVIDVSSYLDSFTQEQKDKMYFKTDPHWNANGAYYAFKFIINSMVSDGALPRSAFILDSDFQFDKGDNTKFEGAFNKRLSFVFDKHEIIPYVNYQKSMMDMHLYVEKEGKLVEENISDFYSTAKKGNTSSYNGAYALGLPYIKIINNCALTDKTLLVSRDSYFSAMSLMFSIVFKEVCVVDLRLYNKEKFIDIVKNLNYDIVLLENSDLTFRNHLVFDYGTLSTEN